MVLCTAAKPVKCKHIVLNLQKSKQVAWWKLGCIQVCQMLLPCTALAACSTNTLTRTLLFLPHTERQKTHGLSEALLLSSAEDLTLLGCCYAFSCAPVRIAGSCKSYGHCSNSVCCGPALIDPSVITSCTRSNAPLQNMANHTAHLHQLHPACFMVPYVSPPLRPWE